MLFSISQSKYQRFRKSEQRRSNVFCSNIFFQWLVNSPATYSTSSFQNLTVTFKIRNPSSLHSTHKLQTHTPYSKLSEWKVSSWLREETSHLRLLTSGSEYSMAHTAIQICKVNLPIRLFHLTWNSFNSTRCIYFSIYVSAHFLPF